MNIAKIFLVISMSIKINPYCMRNVLLYIFPNAVSFVKLNNMKLKKLQLQM